jgi:hypothetical protein
MRTIEKKMLSAIMERKNFSLDNTKVECIHFPHPVDSGDRIIDRCNVYLHDNLIAMVTPDEVTVNNCGWRTNTTKSRLHVILREFCGACVSQSNFEWFLTTRDDVIPMQDRQDYTVSRIPMY